MMEIMSFKKRFAAAAAAAVMALSLAGCGNKTGYVLKADGEEIAAGVYINLILSEYTSQVYSMYYSGVEIEGTYFEQEVDGKPMAEYLENYAYDTCLKIAAVEKRCRELGIELTDDEKKEVEASVRSAWDSDSDYYARMGVSKASIKRVQEYGYLTDKLFDAYYAEGGIEEVTLSQVQTYVDENFLRYKQIRFTKDAEDEGAAAKEKAEKYMALAAEMTMDELIERVQEDDQAEQEAESGTETETDDSSELDSSAIDSSSETDSSSENDSSSETDSSATDSSSETDSSATDSSSETDDSSAADEEAADEEEKTPAEIESENYPNDYIRNKASYEDDEFVKHIDGMELDKIELYEDDDAYYILERLDMKERTGYAEANKESIVSIMKADDFEALVEELVKGLDVEKNDEALKRYNAKDVYERQLEWSEEQSAK